MFEAIGIILVCALCYHAGRVSREREINRIRRKVTRERQEAHEKLSKTVF